MLPGEAELQEELVLAPHHQDHFLASSRLRRPSRGIPGERIAMPKNKTHSVTAKRVKITGTGKLRRQQTRLRHRLEVKPSTVTRRQSGTVEIAPADVKRVKKLLGR